jgi:histidinol-phosphate aminotransferase
VLEDDMNAAGELKLPMNLGLNDGTICPQACIEVMQSHTSRTSLRHYTTPDNTPLREVIAAQDGVSMDNIYIANGSGPLLKQCIPHLIRQKITASPRRMLRHVVSKTGFPLVSGVLTYFKIPKKAEKAGLTVKLLPMSPDDRFKLKVEDVEAELKKQDALVYICNPNNPTGQLMMARDEVEHLLKRYPNSLFWVDEAYVQYIPRHEHQYISDLVPRYDNLIVSRTFSFAYGLAGARMGYLLTAADRVREFEGQVTNYRFGTLQEQLAVAALTDEAHLPELREMTAGHRRQMIDALNGYSGVEAFESRTHFILARFTDGRTGAWLAGELEDRQIHIKKFDAIGEHRYDEWFRITLGMQVENDYLIKQLDALLG